MRVTSKEAELMEFARDAGTVTIRPKVAYFAETEDEVAIAMQEAAARGLPITPRGGGTGIPTQSVGRGAILIQTRSRAVLEKDQVVCQPGLVKAELNSLLSAEGRWMPVDPSSYASCTIGGMVANNSSGIRTMKYGSTIDYVRGLRVVLPGEGVQPIRALPVDSALSADPKTRKVASLLIENQRLIMQERPDVTKNSSGYRLERAVHDGIVDFPKLFTGAEGTLGVVTEATLSTKERPNWKLLFIVESLLEELDKTVAAFRGMGPAALELVDKSVFRKTKRWEMISKYSRSESPYMIFCEFDGAKGDQSAMTERIAESSVAMLDPIAITDASEIIEAWGVRNETLALAQEIRRGPEMLVPGVEDLVVPPDRLGYLVKLLEEQFSSRGLEYIMYGHAGDANLHARPLLDPADPKGAGIMRDMMDGCFESVWKVRGSMTGEHGDGMLRAKYVKGQYPRTYWIMRELKELYDPGWILNPGVKIV